MAYPRHFSFALLTFCLLSYLLLSEPRLSPTPCPPAKLPDKCGKDFDYMAISVGLSSSMPIWRPENALACPTRPGKRPTTAARAQAAPPYPAPELAPQRRAFRSRPILQGFGQMGLRDGLLCSEIGHAASDAQHAVASPSRAAQVAHGLPEPSPSFVVERGVAGQCRDGQLPVQPALTPPLPLPAGDNALPHGGGSLAGRAGQAIGVNGRQPQVQIDAVA